MIKTFSALSLKDVSSEPLISLAKRLARPSQSATATSIFNHVKMFQYIEEKGTDEWKEPLQTLTKRSGDCEDLAILVSSLLTINNVPNEILAIYTFGWNQLHVINAARTEKGLLLLDTTLGRNAEIDVLPYENEAFLIFIEKELLPNFRAPLPALGIPLIAYRQFPL